MWFIYVLIFSLIIVISFIVLVLFKNYITQKHYKIIKIKDKEIQSLQDKINTLSEALEHKKEQFSKLDELKGRFFSSLSHELLTPLTLIKTPLQQLLTNPYFSDENETLELMLRNAEKLEALIIELRRVAHMVKGAVELKIDTSDINQLVSSVIDSFKESSKEKEIDIEFLPANKGECTFPFDRSAMEKVFFNLISNAMKYSPPNKKVLVLSEFDGENYNFSVHDEGIGIPDNEKDSVFERFYRCSNTTNTQGTGIGLSLVRDIVSLHGGKVWVSDSQSGGCVFSFRIPFIEYITPTFIPPLPSEEAAKFCNVNDATRYKLLIVEDNYDLRHYLASNFSGQFLVVEASNGKEGLIKVYEELPDIIISDVMMPIMDGFEFTKAVRNDLNICHIPIILLTAKAGEESFTEGLEVDANAYITKPFSMNNLRATVYNLLRFIKRMQDKFKSSFEINPSEIAITSKDIQFIRKATQAIEDNLDNSDFGVNQFCDLLSLSRASVHRKLIAITGLSTTDFIRTIRLKRAAQLLKGNAGQISEVAYKVGFNDVSYFTKCFKNLFGITPSIFQDSIRQN